MKTAGTSSISAFAGYIFLGWALTLRADRGLLLPALLAAIALALAGALVLRLSRSIQLSHGRASLIALLPPVAGIAFALLSTVGAERELNTPEVQRALEPLGQALARGFSAILGVFVGCLLAGVIAFFATRRPPVSSTRQTARLAHAIGWTLASAASASLFLAALGASA